MKKNIIKFTKVIGSVFSICLASVIILSFIESDADEIELPTILGAILIISAILTIIGFISLFVLEITSLIKNKKIKEIIIIIVEFFGMWLVFILMDIFAVHDKKIFLDTFLGALIIEIGSIGFKGMKKPKLIS